MKWKLGWGSVFVKGFSDKNKEVKTKTIMFLSFCFEANIVNSAATNWMLEQEKQILHLAFYFLPVDREIIVEEVGWWSSTTAVGADKYRNPQPYFRYFYYVVSID